jgi:prepilin-type N-terminal cleavage/methylation domain-containing protein
MRAPAHDTFRRKGFTLVELMIVVAILGILAAISLPTFSAYIYKAKTADGLSFLAEIRGRQESYRSDNFQYSDTTGALTTFYPTAMVNDRYSWAGATSTAWGDLGAIPAERQSRFQFAVVAGGPGLPNGTIASGAGMNPNDYWFIAQGRADLDTDGTTMIMEIYSQSIGVYIQPDKGWE